nr:ribonuclease H-like domain-containing protein [Tanacetum cinerariifolium]GEZ33292.1 ribonuclease H-like domain-containing protein [Tanacetum cinerariifolium]
KDHSNPTFAKIPILNTGKFEQWKFIIQQYLQNEHYALWEVIEFGDSYKAPPEETGKGPASESSARKKGMTVAITTEDMQKRRNDVKARTTLLLALPDLHQLRLKTLEQTFNRLQAIMCYLEFMDVEIEQDDLNRKFLTSLALEWLIGKGEVHTASVPTASTQVSTANTNVAAASLSHDTIYRGKRESYKQGPKVEEPAPKALMAIDGIGWDWSYMANKEENHALVVDDEVPTEFTLMPKSNSNSDNEETREKLLRPQLVRFGDLNKILLNKDSFYSRHMTRNISYLSEYEPYDGGYVSFGHGGGKITGKGIIKTDFKLNDDTDVLLRTLKQHNMNSIDLNNIVPHKNLTCLVAKALVDESLLRLSFEELRMRLMLGPLSKKGLLKGIKRELCTKKGIIRVLQVLIMNEFCTKKGIRRVFSNARTPQQNEVAERRNRALIEAARTMLADAKLPVTFWAEAVNIVCYVQNRVLVNKSQNKTSYELFNCRIPAIGFLRPFGCHVMILNTLDHLGKFDAKGDEGYFVGYSLSSKAIRVFNKRTKKVEENLHVDFLENKLVEKGAGPNWLFDIDTLSNSMNHVPVVVARISSINISG